MSPNDKPASPFAALEKLRGQLPAGERPAAAAPGPAVESPRANVPAGPARAVVRLERKGRKGKEVTVVEQLALGAADLERWLFELKRRLGCGGAVDGEVLVLQGDHRKRIRAILEERGVRRISVG